MIICGAILLLLAVLLFSKIRVRIVATEQKDLKAYASILGIIKIPLYPRTSKTHKPKSKTNKSNTKSTAEVKKPSSKGLKHGKLTELRELIESIVKRLPETFSLRIRKLSVTVGGGDAAQTALLYGGASTALSLLLEWLDRSVATVRRTRGCRLGVYADFETERFSLDADLALTTTVFRLLRFAIKSLIPHYFRRRKKKKNKRNSRMENGTI